MHFVGKVGEYLFIENHRKEFLVLRWGLDKYKGNWHLPGGRLDSEDEATKGMIRELKEEINLTRDDLQDIIPFYVRTSKSTEPRYNVFFKTKIMPGSEQKVKIMEPENFSAYKWMSKEDLMNIDDAHLFIPFLKEIFEKL